MTAGQNEVRRVACHVACQPGRPADRLRGPGQPHQHAEHRKAHQREPVEGARRAAPQRRHAARREQRARRNQQDHACLRRIPARHQPQHHQHQAQQRQHHRQGRELAPSPPQRPQRQRPQGPQEPAGEFQQVGDVAERERRAGEPQPFCAQPQGEQFRMGQLQRDRPRRRERHRKEQAEQQCAACARRAAFAAEEEHQRQQRCSDEQAGKAATEKRQRAAHAGLDAARERAAREFGQAAHDQRQHREHGEQGLGLVGVQHQAERAEGEQRARRAHRAAVQGLGGAGDEVHRERDEERTRQACATMRRQEGAPEPGEGRRRPEIQRRVVGERLAGQHREQPGFAAQHRQHGTEVARVVPAPGVMHGQPDEQVERDQHSQADRAVDAALKQGGGDGIASHGGILRRTGGTGQVRCSKSKLRATKKAAWAAFLS